MGRVQGNSFAKLNARGQSRVSNSPSNQRLSRNSIPHDSSELNTQQSIHPSILQTMNEHTVRNLTAFIINIFDRSRMEYRPALISSVLLFVLLAHTDAYSSKNHSPYYYFLCIIQSLNIQLQLNNSILLSSLSFSLSLNRIWSQLQRHWLSQQ